MRRPLILLLALPLLACEAPAAPSAVASSPEPTAATATAETVVPPDMFTDADLAEHSAALAKVADGKEIYSGLPNPPLVSCGLAADETLCRFEQLRFIREWKEAYAGDYGAQRNVAYGLSRHTEGVVQNRVQGCAWRAVILNAAHPEADEGDVSNFETECSALTPSARTAADAQAARIVATIAG